MGHCRVIELRKLNEKTQHPRWSVSAKDASLCTAVVLPFVAHGEGQWQVDRTTAGVVLVPLLSLGREVNLLLQSQSKYTLGVPGRDAGGPQLHSMYMSHTDFSGSAMQTSNVALDEMRVMELREELEARGESRSGSKAMLRRRLHAAILRSVLEERDENGEEDM